MTLKNGINNEHFRIILIRLFYFMFAASPMVGYSQFEKEDSLRGLQGLPPKHTFSIFNKTGRYTLCLADFAEYCDNMFAVRISRTFYDLKNAFPSKEAIAHNTTAYHYGDFVKHQLLPTKNEIAKLSSVLDSLEDLIRKSAGTLYDNSKKGYNFLKFKISIEGSSDNLVQPQKNDWKLKFSSNIIVDIFKNSLKSVFSASDLTGDMDQDNDSTNIVLDHSDDSVGSSKAPPKMDDDDDSSATVDDFHDETFKDLFEDDDNYILSPTTYFRYIYLNHTATPPCIPVLQKQDFIAIINTSGLIRSNLSFEDSNKLLNLEDALDSKDFAPNYIIGPKEDYDSRPTPVNILFQLINWKNATKELTDLKRILMTKPRFLQHEDPLGGFGGEHSSGYTQDNFMSWGQNEMTYLIISNYIALEMYKYFTFIIAHEAYHAWIAYGKAGAKYEFEADKFATYIYGKIFFDIKFQSLFNIENKVLSIFSPKFRNGNIPGSSFFTPFLGPQIFDIFTELFAQTKFYENQSDGFHPTMKARIDQMKDISSKRLSEATQILSKSLIQQIDN